MRALIARLRALLRLDHVDVDLASEMAEHLEERQAELVSDGMSPEDAARQARLEFGSPRAWRERAVDAWGWRWLRDWSSDIRSARRGLVGQPAFALSTIATLAVAFGANIAIFSVVYGVAFRPLPYPHASRILQLSESNVTRGPVKSAVSRGTFQEWRSRTTTLEAIGLYGTAGRWYPADADIQPLTVVPTSPGAFEVLGVRAILGRGFKPEASYGEGYPLEMILAFEYWQRQFGGDPTVIGRSINLGKDSKPRQIVGVMPAGSWFTPGVDAWVLNITTGRVGANQRATRYDHVIARVRADVSVARAIEDVQSVSRALQAEYPRQNAEWVATAETLQSSIVGPARASSGLLLMTVMVLVGVACLNVSGLLLVRARARRRETAMRVALGATRWRLVRLWLTEAAMIATAGAALGLALGSAALRVLKAAAPPSLPRIASVQIDWTVALWSLFTLVAAIIVMSAVPVYQHYRGEQSARDDGARVSAGNRGQTSLLVAQTALATLLVVVAAVFARSLVSLYRVDLGFEPAQRLVWKVEPPTTSRRPWFEIAEYSRELVDVLERQPYVQHAALTSQLPFDTTQSSAAFVRSDTPTTSPTWTIFEHCVSDGYLRAMGVRLIGGRFFERTDAFTEEQINFTSEPKPAERVAVITESVARTLWPGEQAVGKRLRSADGDPIPERLVIGVIKDLQFAKVGENPGLHMLVPMSQDARARLNLVVEAAGDPDVVAPQIQAIVRQFRPGVHVDAAPTMAARVRLATAATRYSSTLVGAFSIVAVLLVCLGTYGAVAYAIVQRRKDLSIRLALGASAGRLSRALVRAVLTPVAIGAAIGLVAVLPVARLLLSGVFGADAAIAPSCATAVAAIAVASFIACALPLRRVFRISPIESLRLE